MITLGEFAGIPAKIGLMSGSRFVLTGRFRYNETEISRGKTSAIESHEEAELVDPSYDSIPQWVAVARIQVKLRPEGAWEPLSSVSSVGMQAPPMFLGCGRCGGKDKAKKKMPAPAPSLAAPLGCGSCGGKGKDKDKVKKRKEPALGCGTCGGGGKKNYKRTDLETEPMIIAPHPLAFARTRLGCGSCGGKDKRNVP